MLVRLLLVVDVQISLNTSTSSRWWLNVTNAVKLFIIYAILIRLNTDSIVGPCVRIIIGVKECRVWLSTCCNVMLTYGFIYWYVRLVHDWSSRVMCLLINVKSEKKERKKMSSKDPTQPFTTWSFIRFTLLFLSQNSSQFPVSTSC